MTLKYERQWEITEKIFNEFLQRDDKYDTLVSFWDIRKQIIQKIFNVDKYIDWNKLWAIFENDIDVLHLNGARDENWEYQQKPLLDKLIEVILWNKEN